MAGRLCDACRALALALPQEGTGITKLVPHVSPDCVDLIIKLLAYNPDDRLRSVRTGARVLRGTCLAPAK